MFLLDFGGKTRKEDIEEMFHSFGQNQRKFLNFNEFVKLYHLLMENMQD